MQINPQKYSSFGQECASVRLPGKTILLSVLLIVLLGFAVYANTLNNEFVWDDNVLVVDNQQ